MHTDQQPLVSIIIPTYNRAHLIGETLDSVLAQTYSNWECIIVDDGSTDNTDAVVQVYVEKDARCRYFHRPPEHLPGGNGARNFGFKMSRGEYLVFLDSDDLLHPDCLAKRVEAIVKNPSQMHLNPSALFSQKPGDSDYLWNRVDSKETIAQWIVRFLNTDMPWSICGVTWQRAFFIKTGGWDESLIAWQDWDLHVRALMMRPKTSVCTFSDTFIRNEDDTSISRRKKDFKYYRNILKIVEKFDSSSKKKSILSDNEIQKAFKSFIIQKLIFLPVYDNIYALPISIIFKFKFFKCLKRSHFIYLFFIQLTTSFVLLKKIFFVKKRKEIGKKYRRITNFKKVKP